jgi:hypothetical protein
LRTGSHFRSSTLHRSHTAIPSCWVMIQPCWIRFLPPRLQSPRESAIRETLWFPRFSYHLDRCRGWHL